MNQPQEAADRHRYQHPRRVELKLLKFPIMARPRKKPRGTEPWWLSDTTETCPACSQAYAYHTEIRCVDCDGPLCPICVQVTTTMTLSCPECFQHSAAQQKEKLASEVSK